MRLAHVTHPPVVTQAPVWCPAPSPQAMNADASPDLVVQIVWHQPAILTTVMVESALMMLTETLSAQSVLLASQERSVKLRRVQLVTAQLLADDRTQEEALNEFVCGVMMLTETLYAQSILLYSQNHNLTLARVPLLPVLMRAPALCPTKHPQALFASVNQVSAAQTAKLLHVIHTTVTGEFALTM